MTEPPWRGGFLHYRRLWRCVGLQGLSGNALQRTTKGRPVRGRPVGVNIYSIVTALITNYARLPFD